MRVIFILLIVISVNGFSQINESFTDGDFSNNPTWEGHTNSFLINDEQELQLNAGSAGISYLATPSKAVLNASWQIDVKMTFNPSSSNLTRIYLISDNKELDSSENAVYIELGSQDDNICLYKVEGGQLQKMIEGSAGRLNVSNVEVTVKVTREANSWVLSSSSGDEWTLEGVAEFDFLHASEYFGVLCKYTKTRVDKFFFDNIEVAGEAWVDQTPPIVSQLTVINGSTMRVSFNEDIDESSIANNNFSLKTMQRHPNSVDYNTNDHSFNLTFEPTLSDVKDEEILITKFKDQTGNQMRDTSILFSYQGIKLKKIRLIEENALALTLSKPTPIENFNAAKLHINAKETAIMEVKSEDQLTFLLKFDAQLSEGVHYTVEISELIDAIGDEVPFINEQVLYYIPKRFDIVFNEWMADPTPSMGLPEVEYIEIKNNSDFDLPLQSYRLSIDDNSVILPDSILKANGYICLIAEKHNRLWPSSETSCFVQDFPTLNNGGFNLVLYNSHQDVLDAYSYQPNKTMGEDFKRDGGWSVERIDPLNLSGETTNFNWSLNLKGGTPGNQNSVYEINPDNDAPYITKIQLVDKHQLQLHFNETMRFDAAIDFQLNPDLTIHQLSYDTTFLNYLNLHFSEALAVNELIELTNITIQDIGGHSLVMSSPLHFGIADSLKYNDILINEILFNPFPGGEDFVELYNNSDKIIKLSDICLAKLNQQGIEKLYELSSDHSIIAPRSYLAITSNKSELLSTYNCPNAYRIFETPSLPSYPDDEGHVVITNRKGTIIDEFKYEEKMHFSLIKNKEGVSLERLSWTLPATDDQNWSSAASTAGYATPGYVNSQQLNKPSDTNHSVFVEPEVFTPNGDGSDDRMHIYYATKTPGTTASIRIFDSNGIEVRHLANNQTISSDGFFSWDGLRDDRSRLKPGIYIIYVQMVQPNGKVNENKLSCVISPAGIN